MTIKNNLDPDFILLIIWTVMAVLSITTIGIPSITAAFNISMALFYAIKLSRKDKKK